MTMKLVLILALLAGATVGEDRLLWDRQAMIRGLAEVSNGLLSGFGPIKSGIEGECNHFYDVTHLSDKNVIRLTQILNHLLCDADFIRKFGGKPISAVNALYVNEENKDIAIYDWMKETKTLQLRYRLEEVGDYQFMVLDANKQYLVAVRVDKTAIDVFNFGADNSLKPKKTTTTLTSVYKFAVFDVTNKYVLGLSYLDGAVTASELKADGTLDHKDTFPPGMDENTVTPQMLAFHPKAKGVLAVVYFSKNKVIFLKFDSSSAKLTKITKEAIFDSDIAIDPLPTSVVFSNDGKYMYAACGNHFVYTYRITVDEVIDDVTDVAFVERITTVATAMKDNGYVAMVVHPEGKFLYVVDDSTNEIAMFTVDRATGKVSPNGYQPVPKFLTLAMSTYGTFLTVCGYKPGLYVFTIDQDSGKLKPESSVKNVACFALYYG